ncbi:hypothetical protein, partial [Vibrio kanaloae]|uniref:hypothetical protein n=1 Tax=Vibrio kanaloae TaxID=170673 RepID=UPI001EFC3A6C
FILFFMILLSVGVQSRTIETRCFPYPTPYPEPYPEMQRFSNDDETNQYQCNVASIEATG